jgi:DNA-binding NtrC family response regulator
MIRPCFLVVDREFPGSISTRKLVIETAKFNVLTAYSADEALELLRLFPAVSGVVVDDGIEGVSTPALVQDLKGLRANLPVIVVAAPDVAPCPGADFQLRSFEPAKLLETLKKIEQKASDEIEKANEKLSREHLR